MTTNHAWGTLTFTALDSIPEITIKKEHDLKSVDLKKKHELQTNLVKVVTQLKHPVDIQNMRLYPCCLSCR